MTSSILIAAAAMYGIGVPLAWLLPVPTHSTWVLRIAMAPLVAIAVTSPISWLLGFAGIPFAPWMLVLLSLGAWLIAWPRIRGSGQQGGGPTDWRWPMSMVFSAAFLWWLALRDYGLYLPNRDFKNHAYNVAQFALDRGVNPLQTYSSGALATPEVAGLGRIGLHTLLAWALPTGQWSSLGVTAAAAILPSMISLPLGLIVLGRIWRPSSPVFWKLTGMCGVLFPGFTGPFSIGSMSLLFGAALFPAALAVLWALWREPTVPRLIALGVVGCGLAFTHIPEAAGLGLLAVLALPRVAVALTGVSRAPARIAVAAVAVALVVVPAAVMFTTFPYLSEQRRDIQANDFEAWVGMIYPLLAYPSGPMALRLGAVILAILGIWMTLRERISPEPVVVLGVFVLVSLGASWAGAPGWLRALATPWYGSSGRVSLLAGGAVVLLVCLPLSVLAEALQAPRTANALRVAGAVSGAALIAISVVFGAFLVEQRRFDLAASLAGAGDTPEVAAELSRMLAPGETVLNLESDGSANLFSATRVPVVAGTWDRELLPSGRPAGGVLTDSWLDLDEPTVQAALDELGVAYVALGTRNVYWSPSVGYSVTSLMEQPQLTPVIEGSDMVVFRYTPTEGRS